MTSLWLLRDGDELLCATQHDAAVAQALRRDPRRGFRVGVEDPAYHGVRGQSRARVDSVGAPDVLATLIARYLGDTRTDFARWLIPRADREVVLRPAPERIVSWDYRARMASGHAAR